MNAGTCSSDLIHLAHRLLKQDTYYDKMELFLTHLLEQEQLYELLND